MPSAIWAALMSAEEYRMKIIEIHETERQEHWLNEMLQCDWKAGIRLHDRIISGELKDTKVLMLCDRNRLVSFCTLAKEDNVPDSELTPWIGYVYTFPRYRGQHLAKSLIGHACRLAADDGYQNIYVSSNEEGLYEKYGFSFLKMMKDRHGEDTQVFVKYLK